MNKALFSSLFLVTLLTTLSACGGGRSVQQVQAESSKKTKVFLIWSDVTSSLKDSEVREVAKLTSAILDHLPEDSKYMVYPIQNETGRPVHIIKKGPSLDEPVRSSDDRD